MEHAILGWWEAESQGHGYNLVELRTVIVLPLFWFWWRTSDSLDMWRLWRVIVHAGSPLTFIGAGDFEDSKPRTKDAFLAVAVFISRG